MNRVKSEYASIRKETQRMLKGEESREVEFKQSLRGLSQEVIVAMANGDGGTILIGVREQKGTGGKQRGEVVGCRVGDVEKLTILNKAHTCVSPIEVVVTVENAARKPLYRIDVPESGNKPYCTGNGTYKIRSSGKNRLIDPVLMETMYLQRESNKFLDRFRQATKDIESRLWGLESTLDEIFEMASGIGVVAEEAFALSDEAAGGTYAIMKKIESLDSTIWEVNKVLNFILQKMGLKEAYEEAQR